MKDRMDSEYVRRPDAKGHLKVMELLREWDPIGVICDDNQDEYDGYSPTIVLMLDAGVSEEQLYQYLKRLVTGHMGIGCDCRKTREIARLLVDFWKEWKAEPLPGPDPLSEE